MDTTTRRLTAQVQLEEARAHAAAVRAMFAHLTQDHTQDREAMGKLTLTQLEEAHVGLDATWTWGSNEPGFLPDSDTPNEAACWWDTADALSTELEHEGRLAEDNELDFNDSEALLEAAREVLDHRPGEGIELVLRDSTGSDRAFWMQEAH